MSANCRIFLIMNIDHRAEHQRLIKKTIHYLEEKGHQSIKADIEGYETPKSFIMQSTGIEIVPDIVTELNGRVQYIEVGHKTDDTDLLKTKWKFIKALSEIKNRNFRVFSHKGNYGTTDQMMRDIQLTTVSVRI